METETKRADAAPSDVHWLDKYIAEQRSSGVPANAAELQELAEQEGWDDGSD